MWRPSGLRVLGIPVGTDTFVRGFLERQIEEERRLLDAIPSLQDTQCEWLVLSMCAAPRANHLLRTCSGPPMAAYAAMHDALLVGAMSSLLLFSLENLRHQQQHTQGLIQAPRRYGGIGLRSASRSWSSAFFAGWAAALPVWRARFPEVAARAIDFLDGQGSHPCPSVVAAQTATRDLLEHGWTPPTWAALASGTSPAMTSADPELESGEFAYGWQFYASDAVERFIHNRELHSLNATGQALLRSQVGRHSGDIFAVLPTQPHFRPSRAGSSRASGAAFGSL